ncbi:RhuM family protein [Azotobacter vinelandii]
MHRHTAAELIVARADADKTNMGLTHWEAAPHGKIVKSDVSVAKNYLNTQELDYLERIVSIYLEFAELQAIRKKSLCPCRTGPDDWMVSWNSTATRY